MPVPGEAAKSQHDSCVLDSTIAIEKLRSDDSDVGLAYPRDHFGEPAGFDHLGVVVEKAQQLALRFLCCGIVDG